jgi:large subunit ribosomal protein L10
VERSNKKIWIEEANSNFSAAGILIVTQYKGLTVTEMESLRARIRSVGASFKVTKNRLTKLALKGTAYEPLSNMFVGATAVAWAQDPVSAAKVISEFSKDNEKLVLVGGAFGEKILGLDEIQTLAKLPSLDELRAQLIALIMTPATRIAGITQAPAGQLARVFGAYGSKDA